MGNSGETVEYDVGSAVVHQWHLDQFGHMNVRWYSHFFDDAGFQFLEKLGLSLSSGRSAHCVTARTTTEFKSETLAGSCLRILGSIRRIGNKSLTLQYRLVGALDGHQFASCETVEVFVDAATHQPIQIPEDVRQTLVECADGQTGKRNKDGEDT